MLFMRTDPFWSLRYLFVDQPHLWRLCPSLGNLRLRGEHIFFLIRYPSPQL